MSFNFISGWKEKVIDPLIDARMTEGLKDGVAAARAGCRVDTGYMQSTVGGHYNQQAKVATVYVDAKYGAFQNSGYRTKYGRFIEGTHFLEAGLSAMGRIWGGTAEAQFTHLAPKYHERTVRFSGGKVGRGKLVLGHKRAKP